MNVDIVIIGILLFYIVIIGILLFYIVIMIASISLVIWAVLSRIKEKKNEKDKLDKYKKY